MTTSAPELIAAYNAAREPERLAMKMAAMRDNVFSFYRGTAHLFWQRVKEAGVPAAAPPAWCSGDLHLENFGTYRGDNDLTYFDINDFDEAALAPCDWEILRLVTSILVAGPSLDLNKTETRDLATACADIYAAEMAIGKARWIERSTAFGAIGELMDDLKKRKPTRLLDRRTRTTKKGRRELDPDNDRMLEASAKQRTEITTFIRDFGKARGDPSYYALLDTRRRIAGTGGLGLQRFVLLIEGSGSPDGNVLLDLKETVASSLASVAPVRQPDWPDEAARVVAVQRRCQAIAPAQLVSVQFDSKPFMLKELQPTADRLNLAEIAADRAILRHTIEEMARLVAWAQLRSSGRGGSANADAFIAFAAGTGKSDWPASLLASARDLAAVTLDDYKAFCRDQ